MDLVKCHCGSMAELDEAGTNRKTRREEAMALFVQVEADYDKKKTSAAAKERILAGRAFDALAADVVEVRCASCGAFIWHDTKEAAANRWNRAVQKLGEIGKCCKAAKRMITDYDGMQIIKCDKCGRRHMPLKGMS